MASVVSLVVTDIVDSTRLWVQGEREMSADLVAHDGAVVKVVELFGGSVFKHTGDGTMAVFDDPVAAVIAGSEMQRVLQSMAWEVPGGIKVRIAVHSGTVVERDGDYFGSSVNRTARLLGACPPGAVLVSAVTAGLVADRALDGLRLVEVGHVELRGFAQRELAHALVADHLAVVESVTSTASRPAPEASTTLPVLLSVFVGRDAEVAELSAVVVARRMVTLTGVGGVGKTRLAHRVASAVTDRFPAGRWWIDLASTTTAASTVAAFADGIRARLGPGPDPEAQLTGLLSDAGPTLLVLDNCEQIVEFLAPFTSRLLEACPDLSVVATSREPLGLPGEHVWRVEPLSCPSHVEASNASQSSSYDAIDLFVERLREARPRFVLDDGSAALIATICSRVDGIPLAIELAAARARTLKLDLVADGLDNALRMLVGGPRTAPPRHQTLLASISWSYELLDPRCQAILRRISVCPARFDVGAAERIAADDDLVAPDDVLDRLGMLVDKSLVQFDVLTGRYRMLETIRQFGLDRLRAAGELEATLRRHAMFWSDEAVRLGTIGHFDPEGLREALTDVLAMLDWAMTHDADLADRVLASVATTAYPLGRWGDLHRACDWVLTDRPRGPHWAAAVGELSVAANWINRFDVLAVTPEAMELASAGQNQRTIRRLRVGPALAQVVAGDFTAARELRDDAMAAHDDVVALMAVTIMGSSLGVLGQLDELRAMHQLALRLCVSTGHPVEQTAVGPMGLLMHHLAGDLDAAADTIPIRPIAWQLISAVWAATAARLAIDRDDLQCASQALALIEDRDPGPSAWFAHSTDWAHALLRDAVDEALDSATRTLEASYGPVGVVYALVSLAETFASRGQWHDAVAHSDRAAAVLGGIAEAAPLPSAELALLRGRAALVAHDLATARTAAVDAIDTAVGAGLRLRSIDAIELIASICTTTGDHPAAARLLAAATAERERCRYRGRLTSGASRSVADRLLIDDPDSWKAGTALTLEQAIASSSEALVGIGRGAPSAGRAPQRH